MLLLAAHARLRIGIVRIRNAIRDGLFLADALYSHVLRVADSALFDVNIGGLAAGEDGLEHAMHLVRRRNIIRGALFTFEDPADLIVVEAILGVLGDLLEILILDVARRDTDVQVGVLLDPEVAGIALVAPDSGREEVVDDERVFSGSNEGRHGVELAFFALGRVDDLAHAIVVEGVALLAQETFQGGIVREGGISNRRNVLIRHCYTIQVEEVLLASVEEDLLG